jgi:hypothetical protein
MLASSTAPAPASCSRPSFLVVLRTTEEDEGRAGEDELDCIRRAGRHADAGLRAAREHARPGYQAFGRNPLREGAPWSGWGALAVGLERRDLRR